MKANELRIGNYFYYDNWAFISQITVEDLRLLLFYPDNPKYKAVPLTEEILVKAGFEKQKSESIINYEKWIKDGSEWLSGMDGKFYHNMVNSDNNEVKFLHDLQNLYFALKHDELEIEL